MLLSAKALAAKLPESKDPPTRDWALEHAALSRLIDEEIARVTEERDLPRSASSLIDAVTMTLTDGGDMARRDRWLASRLTLVAQKQRELPLGGALRVELDDSLDPLEKKTGGYPGALAALSLLRGALEETQGMSAAGPSAPSTPPTPGASPSVSDPVRMYLHMSISGRLPSRH